MIIFRKRGIVTPPLLAFTIPTRNCKSEMDCQGIVHRVPPDPERLKLDQLRTLPRARRVDRLVQAGEVSRAASLVLQDQAPSVAEDTLEKLRAKFPRAGPPRHDQHGPELKRHRSDVSMGEEPAAPPMDHAAFQRLVAGIAEAIRKGPTRVGPGPSGSPPDPTRRPRVPARRPGPKASG